VKVPSSAPDEKSDTAELAAPVEYGFQPLKVLDQFLVSLEPGAREVRREPLFSVRLCPGEVGRGSRMCLRQIVEETWKAMRLRCFFRHLDAA
jgi:hypothetical protein